MKDNFESAYLHVLSWEGGYVDHIDDPGGATNMGITRRTLAEWKGHRVTKEEVKAISRDEAERIYRTLYWDKVKGNRLPPGIDLAVFDAAVNHGRGWAAKFLQKALGVKEDGIIGPVTLEAVNNRVLEVDLLQKMHVNRALSYVSLLTSKTSGRGWMARLFETHDKAVAMMRGGSA